MKKIAVILAALLPALAWGYDFSLMVPSGQTLYFNYVDGGVEVVRPSSSAVYTQAWDGFTKPVGALTIPASVTRSGTSYPVLSVAAFALYGCTGITSLVIEEGVMSLGNSAFSHCSGITSVDLPSTLASLGSQTFGDCNALTYVTIHRETPPPSTNNGAFFNTAIATCTLHVPCGSETSYSSATPWSNFGSITTSNCTVTILTEVNDTTRGTVTGGGSYLIGTNVVLTATPAESFSFICWSDGDTLNPRIFTAMDDCTMKALFFGLQHDTMVVTVTEYIHDTVATHDTMVVTVTDTIWRYDTIVQFVYDTVTVYPTFYRLQVLSDNETLGLGVGSGVLPAGTEMEVCALPLNGGRFLSWDDGNTDNPRRLTLMSNLTLTAQFQRLGIEDFEKTSWTLGTDGREVTITGVEGQPVRLYDIAGRQLASAMPATGTVRFTLPTAGVYVVRVGEWSAKKIVID